MTHLPDSRVHPRTEGSLLRTARRFHGILQTSEDENSRRGNTTRENAAWIEDDGIEEAFLLLSRAARTLGLGAPASGTIRRQPGNKELLKDIGDGSFTEPYQCGCEDEARSVAIVRRIIKIGDSPGGKISADI